jgi:hypothetical protein
LVAFEDEDFFAGLKKMMRYIIKIMKEWRSRSLHLFGRRASSMTSATSTTSSLTAKSLAIYTNKQSWDQQFHIHGRESLGLGFRCSTRQEKNGEARMYRMG